MTVVIKKSYPRLCRVVEVDYFRGWVQDQALYSGGNKKITSRFPLRETIKHYELLDVTLPPHEKHVEGWSGSWSGVCDVLVIM